MKKIISLFLTLCITITMFSTLALTVYAESGTCGDNVTWKIENGVLTFSGSGVMEDYTNTLSPFENLNFNTVIFEDGITHIGDRVLYGCRQVENITIADSVTEIGREAFTNTSITNINIPDSVIKIGREIFDGCSYLSDVTLSDNLVYIPYKAFYRCGLKEIVIPDKVSQIAALAFAETFLENITIPQNTLLIGQQAFAVATGWFINEVEYTGIKNIYYGGTKKQWNNIKIISGKEYTDGYYTDNSELSKATLHCNNNIAYSGKCGDNATWKIESGTLSVSGIGNMYNYAILDGGLAYPIWLTYDYDTIQINEGITGIGMCAFDETVVSMDYNDYAFGHLTDEQVEENQLAKWNGDYGHLYFNRDHVKKVILPRSLSYIGSEAFLKCNKLTDVYYAGTEEEWNNISGHNQEGFENVTFNFESNGSETFYGITLDDKFYSYDGTEKVLEVSGNIPAEATITYTNNKATEPGTYNVTAVITASGYTPLTLNAVMKIGYIVNEQELPFDGYEVGKEWDNCWIFAMNVYKKIWNTDDGKDLLRNLNKDDKKITAKNTRNFILSSDLGANIRLEDDDDENVHSLILVQKDNSGFTVYHGNYNGKIHFTHYTYDEFAEHYSDYKYFEYITFPDAPEYSKAPQNITVEDIPTKTYGDAAFALTVTPDDAANLTSFTYDSSDKNVAAVDEAGNVTIVGAGETIISVTESGNEEYAKTTVTKKLIVNKKALEIRVDNVTITYGDAININITYTGFINGEDETILTKAVEVSGYSEKTDVGEYDIVLSGAEAANYEISYVNAKLTVNKKDVTVTQLKVFDKGADTTTDATINTSSLLIDGMLLGDDVTIDFAKAIASFATAEIGTDIAVTITDLELVGAHAENYNLTNTEFATTASIKETITASDIAAQINSISVVKDSTEITLPNVPAGYKVTIKSSDNEDVVQANGNIDPVETDTQVGLIFTVINESDEADVADTAVINVIIPASTKINVAVTAEANGTVTGSGKYLKNSDVTVVATPNSGYKFSSWYNGETSVSTNATYTFKAENDIALVAKFAKKTSSGGGGGSSSYVVKFETNGGSKITSQSLIKNAVVKEPTAPIKEGYTFDGWYTDKELTTAYDFGTKVTKGFTLYAKWTEVKTDVEKPDDTEKPDVSNSLLFEDVTSDDWFYDSVKYVYENTLMNGVSDSEFAPNTTLTRAMLVTVLYRNEGEPEVENNATFDDVIASAYYDKSVAWAQSNEIVNGYSETEFAPNINITREQIAAIMYRYAEYKGYDTSIGENTNILSYSDYNEISEYAISSVKYAVGSGLMKGKTDFTINPKDNTTRAEIATILQRFIENNK